MRINMRDAIGGAIVAATGGLFALGATQLDLGSAFQMGPGYFPLVLALIMVGLGLIIIAGAFRTAPTAAPAEMRIAFRGLVVVTATLIVFGLVVRGLGLLPAIAAVAFLSLYASRHATLLRGVLLAVGLTAFCVVIFHYGLGLPIPLFGAWLG